MALYLKRKLLARCGQNVNTFRKNYPLALDIAAGISAWGFGDFLCQNLEHKFYTKSLVIRPKFKWNKKRSFYSSMYAATISVPIAHLWYFRVEGGMKLIRLYAPSKISQRVNQWKALHSWKYPATQTFMTTAILSPLLTVSYIAFQQKFYLKNNNAETISQINDKFAPSIISNICYWPPMDFINFRFIHPSCLVVANVGQDVFWSLILSFICFNNNKPVSSNK